MASAYSKDIVRTIAKEGRRFLAIIIITVLGVTMFSGLSAACVDLRKSADAFFDEHNLHDLYIVSTLGLTDEDVAALSDVDGISAAEGIYFEDALVNSGDNTISVSMRTLANSGIDTPYIAEGSLPENENEAAVTREFLNESKLSIGDTFSIETVSDDEDTESSLKNKTYKITGEVVDVTSVDNPEGNTSYRSTGISAMNIFILPSAVDSEIYTAVLLTLDGAKDMYCYGDEYSSLTEQYKDLIEDEIKEKREEARNDELVKDAEAELADAENDANKELSDAYDELKDAEAELSDELTDAKTQLDEAKTELDDGKAQLDDAKAQLDSSKAQLDAARAQLDSTKTQLASGWSQLEEGQKEVTSGLAELEAGKQTLEAQEQSAKEQFSAAHAEIDAKRQELDSGMAQYEAGKTELETHETAIADAKAALEAQGESADVSAALAQLAIQVEALNAARTQLEETYAQLQEGFSTLESAEAALNEQEAASNEQIAAAKAELEANEQKLTAAQAEIDEQRKTLESGQAQYDAGLAEYESGLAQYNAGLAEYNSSYAEYEEGLAEYEDGLAEYESGKTEGEEKIADGWDEYYDGKAEAEQELADAREKIKDIADATWYVQDRTSLNGYANISSDADSIETLGTVFPIMFFLVAILITLTTITRMVDEDRGCIGTYMALGFTNAETMKKYIYYSLSAGLIGSLIGTLCAFFLLPYIIFTIFESMYLLPYYLFTFVPLPGIMGPVVFIGGIIFATWYAGRAKMRHKPATLMRPKAPKSGTRIFLERISFIWNKMSFLSKVTARNIFRYKKRLAMTMFGIAGCTALLLFGFSVEDSITDLIPGQYDKVFTYDILAASYADDNDVLLDYVENDERTEGFINVEMTTVSLDNAVGESLSVALVVVPDDAEFSSYVRLYDLSGDEHTLETGQVYLTRNASDVLNIKADDSCSIQLSDLQNAEFSVTEITENYLGNYIYMTQSTFEDAYTGYEPNAVYIHVSDKCADAAAYADELLAKDEIISCSSTEELKSSFDDAFELLNMVVLVIVIMSAALAFVVLFTLQTTNISEREREIATIKVLGFYNNEVHSYINNETYILTTLGIILGLPLGYMFAQTLSILLKIPSIYLPSTLHGASYLYAILLDAGFAIAVNLVTNRSLNVLDPAEALKSVE